MSWVKDFQSIFIESTRRTSIFGYFVVLFIWNKGYFIENIIIPSGIKYKYESYKAANAAMTPLDWLTFFFMPLIIFIAYLALHKAFLYFYQIAIARLDVRVMEQEFNRKGEILDKRKNLASKELDVKKLEANAGMIELEARLTSISEKVILKEEELKLKDSLIKENDAVLNIKKELIRELEDEIGRLKLSKVELNKEFDALENHCEQINTEIQKQNSILNDKKKEIINLNKVKSAPKEAPISKRRANGISFIKPKNNRFPALERLGRIKDNDEFKN